MTPKENDTSRKERRLRIGISGSYGGLNLGDEAILRSMVVHIRQSVEAEITVFSRNPADTLERHAVERALPVREMTRDEVIPEIAGLDVFILGGGGILYDEEASVYLREAALAQERQVPVFVYAIGAGPLKDLQARQLVRDVLNGATAITVREREAQKVLEEIGVTRDIHVTADPALLLEPEPFPEEALAREGLLNGRRLIGMSVREPGPAAPDLDVGKYHALLANTADFMSDRYDADIVFVPMESNNRDVQHSHAIISEMAQAQRANVLKGDYRSGQILSLMSRFEFAVGMRLHFLIFAALQNVPFVALPYAGKVSGFLEDLHLSSPPVQQVNPGRLIAYIDRSWDLRTSIREHLTRFLPPVQARSRETNQLLLGLLSQPAVR